jgi:hypothetical protein
MESVEVVAHLVIQGITKFAISFWSMRLEAHQHFKVQSRYFGNKEISAVIFVSFPTYYHIIRAVTVV